MFFSKKKCNILRQKYEPNYFFNCARSETLDIVYHPDGPTEEVCCFSVYTGMCVCDRIEAGTDYC